MKIQKIQKYKKQKFKITKISSSIQQKYMSILFFKYFLIKSSWKKIQSLNKNG